MVKEYAAGEQVFVRCRHCGGRYSVSKASYLHLEDMGRFYPKAGAAR